jgi:hypothetical protein
MLAELIGTRYFGMVNVRLADKIEHGMGSAFNYTKRGYLIDIPIR